MAVAGKMTRQLPGLGEEFKQYSYKNVLDWIITINDPREIWAAQPTYLMSEIVFLTVGLLTFIHSQRVGGRFKWLWLGCICHGFFVENMTFWNEEYINNFWHSQTTIVLLGRRLPLHIVFLYPTFIYTASSMVSRLRLNLVQQALATGLTVVLIDMPYDIMAVKFVHWTWHDTDPNIYDRHYWVPFTSYYFHATFACSFTLAFHGLRKLFCNNDPDNMWKSESRWQRELLCTVLAGFCGMPGGVFQFLPLYHPLHDYYGIHTENCVIALAAIYFLIAWRNDRNPKNIKEARPQQGKSGFYVNELMIGLCIHYLLYWSMAAFWNPEDEVSIGLHEEIGPCNEIQEIPTVFTLVTGEPARRRKFLCLEDYDEQYFDFHCVDKLPKKGATWYTICGTPFPNKAEYVQVLTLICFIAFMIFRTMLFASGPEWRLKGSDAKTSKAGAKKKQ